MTQHNMTEGLIGDFITKYLNEITYEQFSSIIDCISHTSNYLTNNTNLKTNNDICNFIKTNPRLAINYLLTDKMFSFDLLTRIIDELEINKHDYVIVDNETSKSKSDVVSGLKSNDKEAQEIKKEQELWDTMTSAELDNTCVMYNCYINNVPSPYSQEKVDKINLKILRLNAYIRRRSIEENKIKTNVHPMHFEFLIAQSDIMDKSTDTIFSCYREFIRNQIDLEEANVTCRVSSFGDDTHLIYEGTLEKSLFPDRDKFNLEGKVRFFYDSLGNTIDKLINEINKTLEKSVGWKTYPSVWFIIIADNTSECYEMPASYLSDRLDCINSHWYFNIIGPHNPRVFEDSHKEIPVWFNDMCKIDQLSDTMEKMSKFIVDQRKIIYDEDKHWIGNA